MEPAETEDSLTEGLLLITLGEGGANVTVKTSHIRADTTGRLHGHLNGSLQKRNGEVLSRVGRHDETEGILILLVQNDLIKLSLKLGQETNREMAVAKEAPVTVFSSLCEELEGLLGLTLTKGDRVNLDLFLLSELVDDVSWVNTLGQDDDDGNTWARVSMDVLNLSRL